AGFDADYARRTLSKVFQHLVPRQRLPQNRFAMHIHAMQLEHRLRNIETDANNLHVITSSKRQQLHAANTHSVSRRRRGGVHVISTAPKSRNILRQYVESDISKFAKLSKDQR